MYNLRNTTKSDISLNTGHKIEAEGSLENVPGFVVESQTNQPHMGGLIRRGALEVSLAEKPMTKKESLIADLEAHGLTEEHFGGKTIPELEEMVKEVTEFNDGDA